MYASNTLWSIAGGGIPGLVAILSVPIMLATLGFELFAVVSLIISITIFFYVYDAGMSRTMTFMVARSQASPHMQKEGLLSSALLIAFIIGAILTLIVLAAAPFIAHGWLNISDNLRPDAEMAFSVSAFGILPSILSHIFKGILEGNSDFKNANICKMFSGSSIFLAPLILIAFCSKGLTEIAFSMVITRYLALILYIIFTRTLKQKPAFLGSSNKVWTVWKYAKWAAISGFISTTFVYGDRFFVAGYLNPEDLSIYIGSQDILIRYLLIPWSMSQVLMPVFAANAIAQPELKTLYDRLQRRIGVISFLILLTLLLIAYWVLHLNIISGMPAQAFEVVTIQIAGIYFCALSQLPLIYLYAKERPELITAIYVFELVVYILVAPAVFERFGLIGACVVWTSRLTIEYCLLNFFSERLRKCV
ncbi:hypothetical protein MTYP_00846 [Methylophilaceae bacterium]|nr:hypothetical protein MTYP_00846 [Methylophilaceae bacterium]